VERTASWWRLVGRCVAVLTVGAGAIAVSGCTADKADTASDPVGLVVDGLGRDAGPVSEAARECIRRTMRSQPMLVPDLRDVEHLGDLDAPTQVSVYGVTAPCAPEAFGRALVHAFAAATDVDSDHLFVGASRYPCFSQGDLAAKWLVDMRYADEGIVMTSTEMASIARTFYLCARDFVVNGPLARSLDVSRETAACVGSRLETEPGPIPEVAALMFGQLELERSDALERIVAGCTG
jgi:hypothetical protein